MPEKIIDGILYRGEHVPGAYDIAVWKHGGHIEVSARTALCWNEIGPAGRTMTPEEWIAAGETEAEQMERRREHEAQQEARKQANLERAAKRARTSCRRFIKVAAFDEMLTLTYKENQTDETLFKEHFKLWVRRMREALEGVDATFDYCGGYEKQKRGAWHAHVTCYKLPRSVTYKGVNIPSWRLGTEIWRKVVGDWGGMCFVGGRTRTGAPARRRMSCAKMAAYVSAYITKHYADFPDEKQRWSHSRGQPKGERYTFCITGVDLDRGVWEVLDIAFDSVQEYLPGAQVVNHRVDSNDGTYWLVVEAPPCIQ